MIKLKNKSWADSEYHYSEEKLINFKKYLGLSHASVRTLLLCLSLLVVPLFVLIPLVMLPLDDVSYGLSGQNWNQPFMIGLSSTVACRLISTRYRAMVPKSHLTALHIFLASICFVVTVIPAIILVEVTLVYPVPFSPVFLGVFGCSAMLAVILWFERRNFSQVKEDVW